MAGSRARVLSAHIIQHSSGSPQHRPREHAGSPVRRAETRHGHGSRPCPSGLGTPRHSRGRHPGETDHEPVNSNGSMSSARLSGLPSSVNTARRALSPLTPPCSWLSLKSPKCAPTCKSSGEVRRKRISCARATGWLRSARVRKAAVAPRTWRPASVHKRVYDKLGEQLTTSVVLAVERVRAQRSAGERSDALCWRHAKSSSRWLLTTDI
eukprot:scaffold90429_cov69-Phaeocystis_antarctica.AAC.1